MPDRDNGLTAAAYAPLLDLDPPLVGQVLDLLASAGIAAFVEPVDGVRGPYQDTVLPERVRMRLQVDRARRERASEVVGAALPHLRADFLADAAAREDRDAFTAAEVDAAWARIVAGYDEPTDPVGRWSAAEEVEDAPTRSGLSSRLVRRSDPEVPDEPADDPDDHYVPPPPPPLPSVDAITRMAWGAMIAGPTLVLLIAVFGIGIEPWVILVALGAFCGGLATLVARMPDRARQDDGWDDGAVV